MTCKTPSLLLACCALALASATCQPRRPATAVLDGGNPYLAYPPGGTFGCGRRADRLFAVSLTPDSPSVCLPGALRGAHVAGLTDLQRCREGQPCAPCTDEACAPSACFLAPPLVGLDDPDCWLPLEAVPFDDRTHYLVLLPAPVGPPAPSPVPLLPQLVIVSPSAEVEITSDPLHDTFLLGRFGPRLAGAAPPPGGDCDSGNCGLFPVVPAPDTSDGFLVQTPGGVRGWQGSP